MIIKARYHIFSTLAAVVLLIVLSCQSAPVTPRNPVDTETPVVVQQPSSGLVEEVRSLTETGRLSSMLQALELIRSRDISGIDFGRMMSGINVLLITLIYPDSPVRLPAVDLPQSAYTRIIREAERGNYVRPAEDSEDFFDYILPFLSVNDQTSRETFAGILDDLRRAGELRPDSVLPPYFQGRVYELAGSLDQAEAAYRQAYQLYSECYPALAGIARLRTLAGNPAEAAAILSDLIIRYPDSLSIKRQLAAAYYENRDWSRALPAIDEILLSEPRNEEFLLMKAYILIEQGQYSQANIPLDTYASINSSNRNYLFYRARVQAEGNRNRDSALNYLRSIYRSNNGDVEAMIYAAGLLIDSQRVSDQQEGRELLVRLRQIASSSIEVLSLSLRDAITREAWQEAQSYLNRILPVRRGPDDLANAYLVERGLGNNARALTFARELYDKDTSNSDYTVVYISALIDNGRRDEASRMLESRLNSAGGGSIKSRYYYLRSRIQSNEETAISDLRSSIFEDPRNLDAIIAMFEIYHRRREERRAVQYLRLALAIAPDNPRLKRYEAEYAVQLERN